MTTTVDRKQKRKVQGSFINSMMGNNNTLPKVGEGATMLMWSDRHPYQVIEVSDDYKKVKLETYTAEWDKSKEGGMGHQNWILKPTGAFSTLVWKWGAWRFESRKVRFTKEWIESHPKNEWSLAKTLTEEQKEKIYAGEVYPQNVLEGITEEYNEYNKVNIVFGRMEHHYDWSF